MRSKHLLISELEETLLGDEPSLVEFARWCQAQGDALELVYVTTAGFDVLVDLVRSTPLPAPAALISGTGDQISFYPSGQRAENWPRPAGRWDPEAVRRVVDQFGQIVETALLKGTPIRFRCHMDHLEPVLLVKIRRRLMEAGCQVELICSSLQDIDVQPSGVHRGSVAELLLSEWNLHSHQVIVAGAHDADLSLFLRGFQGIAVANAAEGLRNLQSPDVYRSDKAYAAGVLDGLDFWTTRASHAALKT